MESRCLLYKEELDLKKQDEFRDRITFQDHLLDAIRALSGGEEGQV